MFELFLILFLVGGMLKDFALFLGVSTVVDLTLLFGVLMFCSSVFRLYKSQTYFKLNKGNGFILLALLLFSFWLFVSTIYSPSAGYKWQKMVGYCTGLLSFFAIIFTPLSVLRFSRLFLLSLLSITALFLFFFIALRASGTTNEYISSLYLMVGTYVGIAGLIGYYMRDSLFKEHKYLGHMSLGLSFVIALILGGRGPVVFLVLTLFTSLAYRFFTQKIKIGVFRLSPLRAALSLSSISFVFILVSAFVYQYFAAFKDLLERSMYRFSLLFESGPNLADNNSVETRVSYIDFSIETWLSSWRSFLFGEGFGSFGLIYSGVDQRLYPHNLFLEVSTEAGIIGIVLILLFLVSAVLKAGLSHSSLFPIWPSFFYFLNLMKSSSLADSRVFFVLLGLAILTPSIGAKMKEHSKKEENEEG